MEVEQVLNGIGEAGSDGKAAGNIAVAPCVKLSYNPYTVLLPRKGCEDAGSSCIWPVCNGKRRRTAGRRQSRDTRLGAPYVGRDVPPSLNSGSLQYQQFDIARWSEVLTRAFKRGRAGFLQIAIPT